MIVLRSIPLSIFQKKKRSLNYQQSPNEKRELSIYLSSLYAVLKPS